MPAPKKIARTQAEKVAQHAENYAAGPDAIAKMLSPHAADAPREIPTYDARVFDRFVKALRELENAMNAMADIGCKVSVGSVANTVYSENDRRPVGEHYKLDYAINKENRRYNRND